ncbi:Late embryogenesis abundant (LEA) hydroxyproline-rich glycoprotein family, partial [Zea mays]
PLHRTTPRRCPSRLQKSKAISPQAASHPSPGDGGRHRDGPIQRRGPRPRRRGVLVPAAPPALRVRRGVRLLPRLLLLPLPAAHLPGAPRPGHRARRRARGEAPQAAVRPRPGVRAVPPRGLADVPGRPARVRAARAQHPPAPDPRHCRPLQRAPGRRAGPHPRRRDQRPRRAPHHRRRRREDPRARLLLPKTAGVGGLRNRHQPEEPVAEIQAVWRGRDKRVV